MKAWKRLSYNVIALSWTPNFNMTIIYWQFSYGVPYMSQWHEEVQQGILWLSIQHVSCIFIPILHILHKVLTHFWSKFQFYGSTTTGKFDFLTEPLVPYRVTVVAVNLGGTGEQETRNFFTREGGVFLTQVYGILSIRKWIRGICGSPV